jgi:hypothetical protein
MACWALITTSSMPAISISTWGHTGSAGKRNRQFPELPWRRVVVISVQEASMDKKTEDKLDPKAKGKQTPRADFDRNREGLYGGLPETRDKPVTPSQPQPRGN